MSGVSIGTTKSLQAARKPKRKGEKKRRKGEVRISRHIPRDKIRSNDRLPEVAGRVGARPSPADGYQSIHWNVRLT